MTELPLHVREALHEGFEARCTALNEDTNDFIGAFNIGALAFLAALNEKPVARAHVRLEDDGLFADLEVMDGFRMQPKHSPVDLYLAPSIKWPTRNSIRLAAKAATAKLLGYRNWDDANDYRTTGAEDKQRTETLRAFLDFANYIQGEK